MNPHIKQNEIILSSARYKVIRSGRRSGKSSVAIEIMLFTALKKGNRNIFYISPNMKQSRSIIWESLKTRLAGAGQLNESRLEVTLPTQDGGKSRIFLSGFEARENFRGMRADLIVFDETDSMVDFFIGWQEIFRPSLTDTAGKAIFIGTPKKESQNLRRLEKLAETDSDYEAFHFTTSDNPYIPKEEIEKAKKELDYDTFQQEFEAKYLDNAGALFKYTALIDIFSNTVTKSTDKYLIVDIADDGSDKTVFAFWHSLELYRIEQFERLNTESIINQTREYAALERIPYSQIAVDAIGVGAGVASSSLLDGIVGFKSSYGAIKTDVDIVRLPNVHYLTEPPLVSEFRNLRSQCIFNLAQVVNNHEIACSIKDVRIKEKIIEELSLYQDVSTGDGKRQATAKEDIKEILGRSPDISDTLIMRMFFLIRGKMLPSQDENKSKVILKQQNQFFERRANFQANSNK